MTCQDMGRLFDPWVDGELDLIRTVEFDEHLSHCDDCRARAMEYQELHRVMQRRDLYWNAPEHLAGRIRTQLLGDAETSRAGRTRFAPRRILPIAGLALAASLFAVFAIRTMRPTDDSDVAQEVVSSHIRSLMAAHLTDVPSSDQHTVKPWFSGRLDFAPTVQDLAESGYPLVGGRLDYVDGKTVAALVYTHRQHKINLFTWPSTEGDSGPHILAIKGYNAIHWTRAGMTNWAVSDLNAHDLGIFVEDLQRATFHAPPRSK